MKKINMAELAKNPSLRSKVVGWVVEGRVFLYPTDTLYGLGCDATNPDAVKRIRSIKTSKKPFSVIAPSKEWIMRSLDVTEPSYLDRLPGPYTLIFRMKKAAVCSDVAQGKLGVRIPAHPFTEIVQESGRPFVTTSANVTGETPVWSSEGIPMHIEEKVDVLIDDGIIRNPASRVIDLSESTPRVLRE